MRQDRRDTARKLAQQLLGVHVLQVRDDSIYVNEMNEMNEVSEVEPFALLPKLESNSWRASKYIKE